MLKKIEGTHWRQELFPQTQNVAVGGLKEIISSTVPDS